MGVAPPGLDEGVCSMKSMRYATLSCPKCYTRGFLYGNGIGPRSASEDVYRWAVAKVYKSRRSIAFLGSCKGCKDKGEYVLEGLVNLLYKVGIRKGFKL